MDNKKPSNYGPHSSGPFSDIDYSSSESEQSGEEECIDSDLNFSEAQILPFSNMVVSNLILNRNLLLNLVQENSRKLVRIICANYGYSVFTADITQCLSYGFFLDYALRNGYSLTPNFLSQLNGLRTLLSDHIDECLSSNNLGSFLVKLDRSNLLPSHLLMLMNNYSLNFSNSASLVRSRLINFLRSTIIPALVGIINQNTVVRGLNECRLIYSDRDRLFLHVVTVFERLIMLRLMNYWNSFCAINQDFLSLLPGTDYSNPFIVARDNCDFIIPDVSSPAAFTTVHGIYLSFIAVNYLDNIIENTVLIVVDLLRPVILEKVTRICSDFIFLKELRESGNRALSPIIHGEFSRFVDSHVGPEITRFLNETLIWSQRELSADELQPFVTGVISAIYRSVESNLINCCSSVIGPTADSTQGTGESRTVLVEEHVKTRLDPRSKQYLSEKCGFNLDEDFFEGLRDITLKELSSFRSIAKGKFIEAITSGKLSNLVWRDQLIGLMPDIKDATKKDAKAAIEIIKDHITKARIVCASGEKKELNKRQRRILLRNVSIYLNGRFRDNMRKLWRRVVDEISTAGPSGVSSAAGTSGVSAAAVPSVASSAAGTSGVSAAAGISRASVIVGPGAASTAASAVPP
uniref:hypothetical protein n=1 Tax=Candidatus Ichthyocystis hellenicum TaxID=1561003 RepID=UPI003B9680B3